MLADLVALLDHLALRFPAWRWWRTHHVRWYDITDGKTYTAWSWELPAPEEETTYCETCGSRLKGNSHE